MLTERQILEGMLIHSANNLAFALACWDAGSLPAFVAKMNATAMSLGMTNTHYADASGFTSQSVSTPADLLKVTSAAMAIPVFAQTVSMPSVTLPVAGTVSTYTPLLSGSTTDAPGVVGVKSGFTTAAGGGDILAYQTAVGGHPLIVLAAVTSLEGPEVLRTAGQMRSAPGPGRGRRGGVDTGGHQRAAGGHRLHPGPAGAGGRRRLGLGAGLAGRHRAPVGDRDPPPQAREPGRVGGGHGAVQPGEQQLAVPIRTAARLSVRR